MQGFITASPLSRPATAEELSASQHKYPAPADQSILMSGPATCFAPFNSAVWHTVLCMIHFVEAVLVD
jgi:hypothetical protein